MKLRIVKKGKYYYPQYRWFFIWCNFTEGYADNDVQKLSLGEAENYINDILSKTPEVTEVIKEYNL